VQYVAARTANVARNAAEVGLTRGDAADFRPELLTHEKENELLGKLGEFPRVIAEAGQYREAHRVARYLEELARDYHRFYDECRILPKGDLELPAELTRARMWLAQAAEVVLANGLGLLGVTAPERM
jgi:arginyl-tRNA synthetase